MTKFSSRDTLVTSLPQSLHPDSRGAVPDSLSAIGDRGPHSQTKHAVLWSLLVAILWRLLIAVDGVLSHYLLKPCACRQNSILREAGWSANPLSLTLDAMYRGDAPFYVSLARDGYHYSTQHFSTMGFFPLYSILVKGASVLIGNVYAAAAIVATLCFLAAIALFALWLSDHGLARRAPLMVALLLCFPFSLFYAAIYSEPLFLLLALGAFLSFERRRWYLCAVCVALIVLARPTGLIVLPPLIAMALRSPRRDWRSFLPIAAAAISLAGFALYQWRMFGTPLAYAHAKGVKGWGDSPSRLLDDFLLRGAPGRSSALLALMLAIGILFLATLPAVYRRFGLGYAIFSLLCVIGSLTGGLPGLDRYVIVAFPSFAAVGAMRRPKLVFGLAVFGLYGLLLNVALFQQGLSVT
jgi:Mannosyltransferase (PIG-V)